MTHAVILCRSLGSQSDVGYFQTNGGVRKELQNEAGDLRTIQRGIESTIHPQLVRSFFCPLLLFSARYSQLLHKPLLMSPSGTHQLHHREPAVRRGEDERERRHPAATRVSRFHRFPRLILLLSGSSRKPWPTSWGKWERRRTSSAQTRV